MFCLFARKILQCSWKKLNKHWIVNPSGIHSLSCRSKCAKSTSLWKDKKMQGDNCSKYTLYFILIVFLVTMVMIFSCGKGRSYWIVHTARKRKSVRLANIFPHQTYKLSVCHRSQKSVRVKEVHIRDYANIVLVILLFFQCDSLLCNYQVFSGIWYKYKISYF